ncbi:MAG: metalloregulator ArsR/SmtB family transcription factor [Caldilineaceae bacterium]|nr:metalloregulator ArsR/SmtB family transcription factor [Caldilineaceae bacterium]
MVPDYQQLSTQLKLLAHPERLRILDLLRREPVCVCHLEALLDKPQPYISQQLRALREAGIVTDERRGHNIYYQLVDGTVGLWLNEILGEVGEDAEFLHLKRTIPCNCPSCDTDLQVSFVPYQLPKEIEMSKAKMLILCTGNSARSQMAEAFMRKYGGDRFAVYSAGLEAKGLNPYTIRVMEEIGIDMSAHKSTDLREYLGKIDFGYLIFVCAHAEANCPVAFVKTGGQRLSWHFDDPAAVVGSEEEKLAKFREIRDQIDQKVQRWLADQQ